MGMAQQLWSKKSRWHRHLVAQCVVGVFLNTSLWFHDTVEVKESSGDEPESKLLFSKADCIDKNLHDETLHALTEVLQPWFSIP